MLNISLGSKRRRSYEPAHIKSAREKFNTYVREHKFSASKEDDQTWYFNFSILLPILVMPPLSIATPFIEQFLNIGEWINLLAFSVVLLVLSPFLAGSVNEHKRLLAREKMLREGFRQMYPTEGAILFGK